LAALPITDPIGRQESIHPPSTPNIPTTSPSGVLPAPGTLGKDCSETRIVHSFTSVVLCMLSDEPWGRYTATRRRRWSPSGWKLAGKDRTAGSTGSGDGGENPQYARDGHAQEPPVTAADRSAIHARGPVMHEVQSRTRSSHARDPVGSKCMQLGGSRGRPRVKRGQAVPDFLVLVQEPHPTGRLLNLHVSPRTQMYRSVFAGSAIDVNTFSTRS
jgi:hypothetical protein